MKPLNMEQVVRKRKISKLAQDVRKKYCALKLGRSGEDETLNKIFKPVTTPLKQLVNQHEQQQQQLQQPQALHQSPLKRIKQPKLAPPPEVKFLPTFEVSSKAENNDDDKDEENDDVFDWRKSATETFNESIEGGNDDALERYLNQYPPNAHEFILQHFRASSGGVNLKNDSSSIDLKNGPVYNPETSRWTLGSQAMDFDRNTGNLIIGGEHFGNTQGLYNLIFYKDPDKYTKDDLEKYKKVLEKTNLYRTGYSVVGKVKGNSGPKYTQIIKPLLTESKFRFSRPASASSMSSSSFYQGSGLDKMFYNKNRVEYVYWDNVNELVDRMRLLYASKQAGNTSHDNEILSIIEELREAKVIY